MASINKIKPGQTLYDVKRNTGFAANPAIEVVVHYKGFSFDEKRLHEYFRAAGKWIDGEWFYLDTRDFEYIKNYFTSKAA